MDNHAEFIFMSLESALIYQILFPVDTFIFCNCSRRAIKAVAHVIVDFRGVLVVHK